MTPLFATPDPHFREWESTFIAHAIRAHACRYIKGGRYLLGSEHYQKLGELETLLFDFYYAEAALDRYVKCHGDWGRDLIRDPQSIE